MSTLANHAGPTAPPSTYPSDEQILGIFDDSASPGNISADDVNALLAGATDSDVWGDQSSVDSAKSIPHRADGARSRDAARPSHENSSAADDLSARPGDDRVARVLRTRGTSDQNLNRPENSHDSSAQNTLAFGERELHGPPHARSAAGNRRANSRMACARQRRRSAIRAGTFSAVATQRSAGRFRSRRLRR